MSTWLTQIRLWYRRLVGRNLAAPVIERMIIPGYSIRQRIECPHCLHELTTLTLVSEVVRDE